MAMIKFVSPAGWDYGQPISHLIKIGSRGLIGNDRREFLKIASHSFLDQLDNIKFAKDEVPMHLIALGASEAWGPNRNGDGFKEATCRKHHDTFVKFAKFFRNHKNKPEKGDPHYGTVKASAYNEEMRRVELVAALNAEKSAADRNGGFIADKELEKIARGEDIPVSMACVLDPTYPVLTKDQGYLPIAEVRTGMHVWTHKGRWKQVTQLNRRKFTGTAYTFRCNGLPLPLELTSDHPMMAKTFACAASYVQGKAARYFRDAETFNSQPADWTHAEHLQPGDRFFYQPVNRFNGYGAIDCKVLAAIMGYYLAEGSFGYNDGVACTVEFTCNLTDSLPRRLPGLVESLYPDITVSIRPKKNSEHGLAVLVSDTQFAEFLRRYVGRGCKNKSIPPELFNANPDVKLAFLGAWLDGDGWIDGKGGHWSSANLHLVLQGRDLLATLGIPASVYKIDHAKCETSGYENSGVEYTLNVSHLDVWPLAETSEKAANYKLPARTDGRKKPACMRSCPDGRYAYRIAEVTSREVVDAETYNFEVEDDESYSLGGFISHNCRVPYDTCSYCHNNARTRDEYCTREKCAAGGCRDNLTRLVKVGNDLIHMHVDNPNPTWFDISNVYRPADRIAYGAKADYLTKAANDSGLFELQDCIKMAEHSSAPLDVILYQSGRHGLWSEKYASQVRLGYALAAIETSDNCSDANAYRAFVTSAFPVEKLASYGSRECDSQLAALADRKVILNLRDFARLTHQESAVKSAESVLPGIYTRMTADESLPLLVESGACSFIDKTANEDARMLAATAFEAHTLEKQAVDNRTLLSCIRERPVPAFSLHKSASCDAHGEKLASDYAMYKLAALWRAAASDKDFPLTVRMSLRQNRVLSYG